MRVRVVSACAATVVAAAFSSPVSAQAAGQNTIYVNGRSAACTAAGPGTIAAPYCTIQQAADAASPGDLVSVASGVYAAATITRSGTASAPIVFTGNGVYSALGLGAAASTSFVVSGASHVKIQDFALTPGSAADAVIDGGSDVTFVNDIFKVSSATVPAVHVTDASSAVTVQDSTVGSEILVDGGSTGTVVTTNRLGSSTLNEVSVVGAANTAITSNTITGCGPQIFVTGSATGTAIENNVMSSPQSAPVPNCVASSQAVGILVDSASAPSTTEDYNDVYGAGTAATDYVWAGTSYASAADLYAATGKAAHDDNSPAGIQVAEQSPLINSADSAAIGEQPVDINGNPRVLDPLVTPTGAGPHNYYDRGAVQFQDPFTQVSLSFTSSVAKAPVGAAIALNAALTDTWSDKFDYQFKLSNGTTVDGGTGGTASVSFSTPGNYTANLYVIPTNGATAPTQAFGSVYVAVVPQAPLVPNLYASADGPYGVDVNDVGSTDAWTITSVTVDFGDHTSQSGSDVFSAQHTYAKAGTYPITETETDQAGNTASTSFTFTTNAVPPGTLINSGGGLSTFAPAGSTGIAQAAVTSMPDDSSQLVAATTGGAVEFATGTTHGNVWANWQPLSQPGVTATWVGIAGMPNGSTQLIEITSTGLLMHDVRNADGTWQAQGWASPGGSGFTRASITALPDGSTQFVAVTATGMLMHDIRYANGAWQGWRGLDQPGVKVVDASIAGLPDGSSQIVEVSSTGVMLHSIRYANGAWQSQGWASPDEPAGIAQVSIGSTSVFGSIYGPGSTIISAVTSQGGLMTVFRNSDGSWSDWTGTASGIGNLGTAAKTTVATLPEGSYLMFTVTGG